MNLLRLRLLLLPLLSLVVFSQACSKSEDSESQGISSTTCETQYPILLVHGVALRDKLLGISYFNRIPKYLSDNCKVPIFFGNTDAFGLGEDNADQLKKTIINITDNLGYGKVNVIAHSKGGLDMRFMFYRNNGTEFDGRTLNDRVASFTTLGTPHRGSVLADYLFEKISANGEDLLDKVLTVFGRIIGDSNHTDPQGALDLLTRKSMEKWNATMGDLEKGIDGVYCQSWAGFISGAISDPVFFSTSSIMAQQGSPVNDGAVEEPSAIYGNYRGTVGSGMIGGVSHMALVDKAQLITNGVTPGFDPRVFYQKILSELSERGY